jgi:hypothetical protein
VRERERERERALELLNRARKLEKFRFPWLSKFRKEICAHFKGRSIYVL